MTTNLQAFNGSVIRKLNNREAYCYFIYQMVNGALTTFIRQSIQGEINEDILRQSLKYVQLKHPLLRACIKKNKDGLFFYSINEDNTIPLTILKKTYPDQWKEVGRKEIYKKFDLENGPLVRVLLLKDEGRNLHDLIVIYQHCILDGITNIIFLEDTLSFYSKIKSDALTQEDVQETIVLDSKLNLDIENLNYPGTPKEKPSLKKLISHSKNIVISLKDVFVTLSIGKRLHFTLDRDASLGKTLTNKLRNACKDHGVSFSGILWAVVFSCLKEELPHKKYSLRIPVNLRNYYVPKISNEIMGSYNGFYETTIATEKLPDDIWAMAKYINQHITAHALHNALKQSSPKSYFMIVLSIYLIKIKIILNSIFNRTTLGPVLLSHAGKFNFQNKDFVLKAYHWGGNFPVSAYFRKSIIFTSKIANEELHFSLSSNVSSECSAVIMQKIMTRLNRTCN